jgi:hypothetical protein
MIYRFPRPLGFGAAFMQRAARRRVNRCEILMIRSGKSGNGLQFL